MSTDSTLLGATLAAPSPDLKSKMKRSGLAACVAVLAIVLGLGVLMPVQAQTFTSLYSFKGVPDGESPYGGLVMDSEGSFYGTTVAGGKFSCGSNGCGTVFKLAGTKESWVYSFQGPPHDGATPGFINLITDGKGNFYGTTAYGGNGPCKASGQPEGCGTIFKITSAGEETVLYDFQYGPKDGAGPNGTLVIDESGNLYGTTEGGGNLVSGCNNGEGCGTVFELTSARVERVLYKFCPNPAAKCPDGAVPTGVLVRDNSGNLYGTTAGGGSHLGGTVFKVIPSSKEEEVFHNFCGNAKCTDGQGPLGGLALDEATGILYGTTVTGGTGACGKETTGGGTVFRISTSDKNFDVLHSFDSSLGDGCNPYGTVTIDKAGNLYGTTLVGGKASPPAGTVWMISGGNESVLYNFNGAGAHGSTPVDTLIVDAHSNLYGTTIGGGGASPCTKTIDGVKVGGCGIVFKLTP